jgi:hypothetical protein
MATADVVDSGAREHPALGMIDKLPAEFKGVVRLVSFHDNSGSGALMLQIDVLWMRMWLVSKEASNGSSLLPLAGSDTGTQFPFIPLQLYISISTGPFSLIPAAKIASYTVCFTLRSMPTFHSRHQHHHHHRHSRAAEKQPRATPGTAPKVPITVCAIDLLLARRT